MIVPSIDIQDGAAVQLVGGKEKALDGGDPLEVARRFAIAGPLAVIDLDAAMGVGHNRALIEALVRRHRCRVGGGIRSVDDALHWLNLGAEQVILGTAARPEILSQLPKERVIAALDAEDGEVVVEGWKTRTGTTIEERMVELAPYVGGFLVTFVEREGRLGGTDLERVKRLVELAGDAKITIAGGVTTADEVKRLDRLGCDAQVGMALYTGRMSLGAALWAPLRTDRSDGLVATVVTDEHGVALGLCWSNQQSLEAAVASGRGIYWSRKRKGLWVKGETSGATQRLLRIDADCDRDALRFTVRQEEPGFCHLDTRTCWGADPGLGALDRVLASRRKDAPTGSYTRRLFDDPALLASKLREEVEELIAADARPDVVHEVADVVYFAMVSAAARGVRLDDVTAELDRRSRRITRRPGDAKEPLEPQPEHLSIPYEEDDDDPVSGGDPFQTMTSSFLDVMDDGDRVLPVKLAEEIGPVRRSAVDGKTLTEAAKLVEEVRVGGEGSLRALAVRFGDIEAGGPLVRTRDELLAALKGLDKASRGVLERTASRIREFAEARMRSTTDTSMPIAGGRAGVRLQPVRRAGCYAPGGRYPLPSSVLMTAITARAAGVESVWVASPRPAQVTLAAAALAGADALLTVGGAQAIAAMAYGAGPVPACDAIVGPGNRWVTAAKQLVAGQVAIDMLAGPSELVVIADPTADPDRVAADLLAQAEHDPDAVPMLVCTTAQMSVLVDLSIQDQLETLPTAETASRALANGFSVVVSDLGQAAELVNRIAPEHLALHVRDPQEIRDRLRHYGALFVGEGAAEVLGDYGAGPNHVLPTGGTARSFGALDVLTFLRPQGWLQIDDPLTASAQAQDAAALARLEGLEAHARAAERRIVKG